MVNISPEQSNENRLVFSLKMRAAKKGVHISGAERIISKDKIPIEMLDLFNRAMGHVIGHPDEIHFSIEEIKNEILHAASLPISTILTGGVEDSRNKAALLLSMNGIAESAINRAFDDISQGASPEGKNMRGAMIIDMETGERLEPDSNSGVRASMMDFSEEAERAIKIDMERIGVKGSRVKEAIALATKVAMAGTIAELCWSDNPDYTTGYVASKRYGYVRFPHMKKEGDINGGRAFFIKGYGINLDNYMVFLRERPLLITEITPGIAPCPWDGFLKRYED